MIDPEIKQYIDERLAEFISTRGGTVEGYLALAKEAPVMRNHAANKGYVDDGDANVVRRVNEKVSLKGDVMRGLLTLWGTPVIDMHAAPKGYVDAELQKAFDRIEALEKELAELRKA